jgi:hypothetical protein
MMVLGCNSFSRIQFKRKKYSGIAKVDSLKAMMPGSPIVVGTIIQGLTNGLSLFSNLLLFRL